MILFPAERQDTESCRQSQHSRQETIMQTVSTGSHFSRTVVLEGSKRSQTVSAEAKSERQSRQEAKIGGLVYTMCSIAHLRGVFIK